ncbi:hypothetical protein [Bordetella bronchiseptica]|uniref:hypothetical protein n=1 Tax=Bordetella bronchiseptica TaxID=518 RepID=UPI000460BECB|nr:hypothetical protein [Bordetella bronchiseptica]KDD18661.1 hypothetical protein L522_4159 [Bordetella bronchiseptica MBORD707]
MNYANLPSPGVVNGGFELRMKCARAISAVEILAAGGTANGADKASGLADFFDACAAACRASIPDPAGP